YDGIFIPKGTLCLTNLWHCHHDPFAYGDDAAVFRPGRFLHARGEIISGPAETREEGHSTYGFGRRVCVGKHVANESLFIHIATTLWAATLERTRGQYGEEVPLDADRFADNAMVLHAPHAPRHPKA
ncbi:cytochrome P450, partial [Lactarius psammicola]